MATSQDFVNWVCGPHLNNRYLHYALMLEQHSVRTRFAHGSTHQTMYYPEAKALHILLPARKEQDAIAEVLGALDDKIAANDHLISTAEQLMVGLASMAPAVTRLEQLAHQSRASLIPSSLGDAQVSHYSLPAFDAGVLPVIEAGAGILSGKFIVSNPSVLMSKLNPRFPRVWNVPLVDSTALASTEFVVLHPQGISTSVLWAVLSQPGIGQSLVDRASGTSGSHQRVRPQEILGAEVVDARTLSDSTLDGLTNLGLRVHATRGESARLARLRDALLPELMSGRVRVKVAVREVEAVL